jgi:Cys-tRNA(Pro) deacylase
MAKKPKHISETPATQMLRRLGVAFAELPYDYVDHGGTAESARQLGMDEHAVIKTLVMQDERAQPLIVLMHGDRQVSTKQLAREIGCKSVEPCAPDVAQRHSGYLIGGTSPFGFRREAVPVFVEEGILALPRIAINGGRRGFLVGLEPRVLIDLLGARAVHCALDA